MNSVPTSQATLKKLYIAGVWREAADGKTFATVNPATGETLASIAAAGTVDVDEAVQAARRAFDDRENDWKKMSPSDRAKLLWRLADLIEQNIDELARLETLDNGKPIYESRNVDMPMVAEVFRYYAGWATKVFGETIPSRENYFNYTLREPIGVVAAITPWNFPLLLASWKIAPALATGNTVIHKPASLTPLTALKFAELVEEAGAPAGVFNVITGKGSEAGDALVEHPGVDKIAFTGSTEVGREVMRKAANTVKHISLELGGKSPNIVFADADLEAASRGAYLGIFYGKGEVCAAGSRLLVEESVHDSLLEKLLARTQKLQPADPLDPKTRLGAVVSEGQMNTVLQYIDSGKKEGAVLIAGGERTQVNGKGYFIQPTIFDRVGNHMKIAQEEIFGPVLATIPFKNLEEALQTANSTRYGLAAAVWTRDIKKAHRVARQLRAGTVWINTYNVYDPTMPFGGFKQSGFGRELGKQALDLYTQSKSVWVDLNE
ncbi:MAG: aldehyde dehydrogenase family protein [Acidobacteriia bacterium]|nr:aldehyde dehydrogenase family protein [Terriglobia bacterium]